MTSTGRPRPSAFRGGLDAAGKLIALECKVVSASAPSFGRSGGPPLLRRSGSPTRTIKFPTSGSTGLNKDLGIRFGFWRSVNHSHNPFMFEGFIDELARGCRAGSLPVSTRDATT